MAGIFYTGVCTALGDSERSPKPAVAYMVLGKHFHLGLRVNYLIWDFSPD